MIKLRTRKITHEGRSGVVVTGVINDSASDAVFEATKATGGVILEFRNDTMIVEGCDYEKFLQALKNYWKVVNDIDESRQPH